jgi:hypothetical protein
MSGYNPNLEKARKVDPEPVTYPRSSSPQASVASLASQLNNTSISSTDVKSPPPTPAPSSPPPSYGVAQADVLYDYRSTDEGDLNLTAGEKITILEYGRIFNE